MTAKFTQLPGGQILIIGKPPSDALMAEIADKIGPTESAVEIDAKELEAFLMGLGGEGQNDWGFSVGDRVLHKEIRSSKKCGSGFGTVISADAEAIRVKWDDSANGTPWFGTYDKDWFRIHPGVMIVMTTGDPPSGKDA